MTATIHYLRKGRKLRATGTVIWRDKAGLYKVKPSREDWGCVIVTPEEIEAGNEKPAYQPREKRDAPTVKTKRERKKKPQPTPIHEAATDSRFDDTPETDAKMRYPVIGGIWAVDREHARKLERERDRYAALLREAMRVVYETTCAGDSTDLIERFEAMELTPEIRSENVTVQPPAGDTPETSTPQ